MKYINLCDSPANVRRVYEDKAEETVYTHKDVGKCDFKNAEAIFTTWGMPALTENEITAYFPNLRYLFYAAGSVQAFARPFLRKGVRVFSAWKANAVPVIEYAVSQITLANKGFYTLSRICKENYKEAASLIGKYGGNFEPTVGILGYGAIGSEITDILRKMNFKVLVFAPDFTHDDEIRTGAVKSDIHTIFRKCPVVSNHMANLPATRHIIDGSCFRETPPYATFINTGRGAQVSEQDLIEKLREDPTYTALLDVTDPEPPDPGSPLYTLPNVVLTPHIAGSSGHEVTRMGRYMKEEALRIERGETPLYEITLKMLETMA